jgi:hypothetical protein
MLYGIVTNFHCLQQGPGWVRGPLRSKEARGSPFSGKRKMSQKAALIVVDMQNDFCPPVCLREAGFCAGS